MTKNETFNYNTLLNGNEQVRGIRNLLPQNSKLNYAVFKNSRKIDKYQKEIREFLKENKYFLSEKDEAIYSEYKQLRLENKLTEEFVEKNKKVIEKGFKMDNKVNSFMAEEEEHFKFHLIQEETIENEKLSYEITEFIYTYLIKEDEEEIESPPKEATK